MVHETYHERREGCLMLGQVKRVVRPTDVPDTGLICDLLWADPDKDRSHLSMSNIGLLS